MLLHIALSYKVYNFVKLMSMQLLHVHIICQKISLTKVHFVNVIFYVNSYKFIVFSEKYLTGH